MFVPLEPGYFRMIISAALIGLYIIYLQRTITASKKLVQNGHGVHPQEPLLLTYVGLNASFPMIIMQLTLGLIILLIGAKGFINSVEHISHAMHVSALLLSLLIIPLATELPEKVNSILWVRKNKDTLGVGNITGAMVFQGALLPALGILLTPWSPTREVLLGIGFTFIAAAWLRLNAMHNGLSIKKLLTHGIFYLLYISLVFL